MKQERLNLYRIDMKYIRNLHNIDDRVSSVSPQIGKQHRIYVGTVVGCNNRKYLILLSHPVEKHKRMSPRADFDKIIDKKGKLLGELNYNLMIPVDDKQLIKVDLKENKKDTPAESHYKQLCIDELTWCRKNAEIIINKANCLYNLCMGDSNYKGKAGCLDFAKLENKENWKEEALDNLVKAGNTNWGTAMLIPNPVYRNAVRMLNRDKISLEDRAKLIGDIESLHTFAHIINRTRRCDIGNFTLRKPETLKVSCIPEQQERFDRKDGDLYNELYFDDSPY